MAAAGDDADKNAGTGNVGDPVESCGGGHPLLAFGVPEESGGTSQAKTGVKKTVTAKLVEIWFRADHTVSDPNTKLLRPSAGDMDDAKASFTKPEWDGSGKCDPVSMTMNNNVTVDLVIDITVSPAGQSAQLTHVKGTSAEPSYNFDRGTSDTVGTERKIIYWLQATSKTPNSVQRLSDSINWTVTIDGADIALGTSGTHVVYSTLDRPWGKMMHDSYGFHQTGADQDVTEERLKAAMVGTAGESTARGCADGVFKRFGALGLHYSLGNRWPDTANGMTLHHWLWKVAVGDALAECHMLGSAFIMVCEMLGVQGPFAVGYMYPWGRRETADPYPARATAQYGRYNTADEREHTVKKPVYWPNTDHGHERMIFDDSSGKTNNFEGVASYQHGSVLYAIGEGILDKFSTADENASSWYQGANFALGFTRGDAEPNCDQPYPPAVTGKRFHWSD